ncbi:MAG: hypothetical protein ACFKPT_03350 [Gloeotrichia echinulata GP01]
MSGNTGNNVQGIGDWGLGIGDWGLGIGDWGLGIGDWVIKVKNYIRGVADISLFCFKSSLSFTAVKLTLNKRLLTTKISV